MEKLSIREVIEATGGSLLWGDENAFIQSVTTDSRKSGENMLFVPLEGDTFDGHEFIRAAFDMGALAALTHKDTEIVSDRTLIRVDDTKKALGDIAKFYLEKYRVPVVAITGSVGKTTTKDMVAASLAEKYSVLKTQGNFNNDIGLPLTVFGLKKQNNMAVLEMGMNHFGEIDYLASIAKPDMAIITNIGMSHIENLGSREGILKAKMEITNYFDNDCILFINADDDMLSKIDKKDYKIVRFGIENDADYKAENIVQKPDGVEFDVVYAFGRKHMCVNLPGRHNIYNALATFALSKSCGVEDELIAKGITSFSPSKMRMDIKNTGKITIINDCYNSSPASVCAALDVLCAIESKRKVAILGDILEMGDFAPNEHGKLGRKAANMGIDVLVTVGKNARYMYDGAISEGMSEKSVFHFENNKEFIEQIESVICEGDAILIKASRGMKFEQITQAAEKIF